MVFFPSPRSQSFGDADSIPNSREGTRLRTSKVDPVFSSERGIAILAGSWPKPYIMRASYKTFILWKRTFFLQAFLIKRHKSGACHYLNIMIEKPQMNGANTGSVLKCVCASVNV